MKARATCLILGVFIMSCSGCPGGRSTSPELEAADKLFDAGTFEAALMAYEAVYADVPDEAIRWKAFHRACECLSHLYRYGEAAQKLLDADVPEKMPHRPRFLLLRAELLQSFLMQYSHVTSGDVVDDEGKEDVFRKTPDEIRAVIRGDYASLWDMREELADAPMSDEGYFFDVEGVHFGAYPTLLDYLVYSATDYLLDVEGSAIEEGKVRPDAGILIVEDFEREVSFDDPPALLAPALMDASGAYETKKRREAVERWKVKRLLVPFEHGLYEWGEEENAKKLGEQALALLLAWFTDFRSSGGRAEAGTQAASMYEGMEEYVKAVDTCRKVEDRYSKTYAAYACKVLRTGIQEPRLDFEARTVLPPAKSYLRTSTRNLDTVHFRAYAIDPDFLRKEIAEYSYYFYGWSGLFGSTDRDWLEEKLLKRKPVETWSVETGDRGDHKWVELEADAPELGKGVYLILASESTSFSPGRELLSYSFVNVTELVVVGTPGVTGSTRDAYHARIGGKGPGQIQDDVYRFYTLDARTGAPVGSADLDVWATLNGDHMEFDITSDEQGLAPLEMKVSVDPPPAGVEYWQQSDYYNHYGADPLARKDGSYAYWSSGQSVSYAPQNPVTLFLESDRPIYRPGHEVQAKVVAVKRTAAGYRTLGKNRSVKFEALDPNGESFHVQTVDLGEFGSATTTFTIPKGRILGSYTLKATVEDGQYSGEQSAWFQVEEYKQPEFEIEVDEAKEPWKYDRPVKIAGSVSYYFGGPVANADLKYVIRRSMYVPWYYRYWFTSDHDTGSEELATGEMKTGADGTFTIDFTPTAPPRLPYQRKLPDMASYTLEVEARDSGGRTIQGSQSFKAGRQALYFTIEPETEFFRAGAKASITAKLMTMNDTPSKGKSSYGVFRLKDEPAKTLADLGHSRYGGQWGWTPPIDVQLAETASGKKVASGSATHGDDGAAALVLDALDPGAYRIVMTTKDAWGEKVEQEKIFVVAGEAGTAVPVHAASVSLVEKQEYEVGDEARFVLGSDLAGGAYVTELWAGEYFLGARPVSGPGTVTVVDVPVTQEMKGGFTLRWFGLKDLAVHQGQLSVAVPWKEKKLAVSLDPFDEKLAPGQEATWGVKLADAAGKPVRGETLALMYDRALEYYVTSSSSWLDVLYLQARPPTSGIDSAFDPYVASIYVEEGLLEKLLEKIKTPPEPPKPPGVRTWETWAGGRPGGLFRSRTLLSQSVMEEEKADYSAMPAPASPPAEEMDSETRAPAKKKAATAGKLANGRAQQAPEVETRSAFADTAFFHPFVQTDASGAATFSFKAPDQLTSWKIKLLSFTTDVKEGSLTSEAVTKKDLMVRADIPRFFREKDRGTVTAVVHNESEGKLSGELFIEITEEGEKIHERIKLGEDRKSFSIEPHGLASFDWMIDIPEGTATWKVRVVAAAGDLTDAEERDLPILPSRQRLIESAFVALTGKEVKKLEIKLEDDPTRINESMTLQVDPQLALDLLNTIPFLIEYPYECIEQTLNRFVPLAIVNQIYKEYPAIRKAMGKVPKRDTVTPPWDDDDPRRLITLMETPWVRQAEGYKPKYPLTDMLDPQIVQMQKQTSLGQLQAAQLPDGGFPWFPGGRADVYITLYVLAGFAEAQRYGVEIPADMIDRALGYVNQEIPKYIDKDERNLATMAFAAWVLTSFDTDTYSEASRGHKLAKGWVKHIEKHVHALTPFGKAYLAYTHHRLGNSKRANELLDMIMDSAREDPIVGVYWAPEKYSWVWYSDSVEKHAFILRTLQELRPDDSRIPGMVQWLVFNRKGNVWKSTKASSAAVFALLDYLEKIGALGAKETFKVDWGFVHESIVVQPDDFLEEPLRWHVTGPDLTEDMTAATVAKDGPGPAFASMTWIYSTDQLPEASAPGLLEIKRTFYRRVKEGDAYHLKTVASGDTVYVGDEVVVQVKITSKSNFEYMHLKDPKAAGFEAETLLSGWKWDPLATYEEPRDSLTNFFMSWVPHGEYILKYTLRPTKPGTYRVGAALLQSMYAPEMTAHSAGHVLEVVKKD